MKILYVQDTDWIRRNPMQHNHLAERMVLRGHEVRVIDYEILWRSESKKELFSKRQTFRVSRLLKGASHLVIRPPIIKFPVLDYVSMLFTYRQEIKNQLHEFKPDVIIGDCILTPFLTFGLAKKQAIPTIYYVLDISHKLIPFKFLHFVGRFIESVNFRNADLILSINQTLKEYCLQMGANPDKSLVFKAGFDSSRFHEGVDGCEIRKRYGVADDDILLLFVGWLHYFNGIKEVAIELAKTQDNHIKLIVVGDGDAFEELQAVRGKYALHEKFILTGRKPYDEVPSFIAASDICLLPAYPDEPIIQNVVPMKMSDYMAMGKPVIATRLPGIMKEFGEGNGIVYIERPEDTVGKAIELAEAGNIGKLGAKARSYVEKYDWDDAAAQFENILKGVAKKQNAG